MSVVCKRYKRGKNKGYKQISTSNECSHDYREEAESREAIASHRRKAAALRERTKAEKGSRETEAVEFHLAT